MFNAECKNKENSKNLINICKGTHSKIKKSHENRRESFYSYSNVTQKLISSLVDNNNN